MQTEPTYYDVLEVAHTASPEVIQAAYRRLCQKYHPDVNGHDSEAHSRMVRLNAAYGVLNDAVQRQAYDALLAAAGHTESGRRGSHSVPKTTKAWGHMVRRAVSAVAGGVVTLVQFVLGTVFWLFIVGVIVGLVNGGKNGEIGKSTRSTARQDEPTTFLQQVANAMNARVPYDAGKGVYVQRVKAEKDKLFVTAVLSKFRRDDLNVGAFETEAHKQLASAVCADQDLRHFLNQGATWVYDYFGNDHQFIAEIPIGRGDCEAQSQANGSA